MEANQSINSSDEVDQPELDNTDLGMGRSYQCVFCRRGFTTAQALGGHMNIHRKDRAKTSTKSNSSSILKNKQEENVNYTGPRFYQPISSYTPRYAAAQGAQIHYRTFFPASTSSTHDHQNSIRSIPFEEDCHMNLSLQFGTTKFVEDMEKRRFGGSEDDGLDLELRLGHDP